MSKKLEPHNVRLAIDNFGRAYSTLAKAEEMPFEELKLDKSFVADCGNDKVNAPLCKTVIDLAHSFGRYVVAAGIEKAADAVALVSMGCDYGKDICWASRCRRSVSFRFCANARRRRGSAWKAPPLPKNGRPDPQNFADRSSSASRDRDA